MNLADKPKWFLEKNPLGKVPTLEHDGKVIYESNVVNEYLDDIFPQTSILPKDPYERAHQKILVERLSSVCLTRALMRHSNNDAIVQLTNAFYGLVRATPETKDGAIDTLKKALANAESLLNDDFYGGWCSCIRLVNGTIKKFDLNKLTQFRSSNRYI